MGDEKAPASGEASGVTDWPTVPEIKGLLDRLAQKLGEIDRHLAEETLAMGRDFVALRERVASLEALGRDSGLVPVGWLARPLLAPSERRVQHLGIALSDLTPELLDALVSPRGPNLAMIERAVDAWRAKGKLTDSVFEGGSIVSVVLSPEFGELRVLLRHPKLTPVREGQAAPLVRRRF